MILNTLKQKMQDDDNVPTKPTTKLSDFDSEIVFYLIF